MASQPHPPMRLPYEETILHPTLGSCCASLLFRIGIWVIGARVSVYKNEYVIFESYNISRLKDGGCIRSSLMEEFISCSTHCEVSIIVCKYDRTIVR